MHARPRRVMSAAMEPDPETMAALLAAFQRWQHEPPILAEISRLDAYMLMCGLQLLTRHPDMSDAQIDAWRSFGRTLQDALAGEAPELAEMMEAGWDPARDV